MALDGAVAAHDVQFRDAPHDGIAGRVARYRRRQCGLGALLALGAAAQELSITSALSTR